MSMSRISAFSLEGTLGAEEDLNSTPIRLFPLSSTMSISPPLWVP